MVKRVNRKKILLLRFDNFEEGAKLILTGCVSYFAANLIPFHTFAFLLVLLFTKIPLK